MVDEARLVETESGLEAEGAGWFVVNARDAAWWRHRDVFGYGCPFGGRDPELFPELGITLRVLRPGEPNCRYHAESTQEDFLVLQGECLVLVEGEERPLKAWDFVHSPAGTEHVIVGAGESLSIVLAVGARPDERLHYPQSELAARYGASAEADTSEPQEAYARFERPQPVRPEYWNELPWA